jgi:hypothetical protein
LRSITISNQIRWSPGSASTGSHNVIMLFYMALGGDHVQIEWLGHEQIDQQGDCGARRGQFRCMWAH